MEDDLKRVSLEGRTYSWTGKAWIDVESFTRPPAQTTNKLNTILLSRLNEQDEKITDFKQLLDRAKDARERKQYTRAESLARKALQLSPDYPGALAVLCSCLRSLNRPEEALEVSESNKMVEYPPLILSRAAALCDLGRWEDAKIELKKVLTIAKKHSSWGYVHIQASKLLARVKAIKPDLF
jgi:tetratricopeptide (TPR) repeat protein